MKKVSLLIIVLFIASASFAEHGEVIYKYWGNIPGTAISDLLNALSTDPNNPGYRYPDNPDSVQILNWFEAPINVADTFGAELSGWLLAPQTGDYTFWIASDDNGELWISSDYQAINAERIAWINSWGPSRTWRIERGDPLVWVEPNQGPKVVALQGGHAYYVMARYKEGGGGDNCAVAWAGPGFGLRVIGEGDASVIRSSDPRLCSMPLPAKGSSNVPRSATLGWSLPVGSLVASPVLNVYLGTDPASMALVIDRGASPTSYAPGALARGTTYYWRVDTVNAPDPNSGGIMAMEGTLWSFTTDSGKPIITQQPQNAKAGPGCAGVFTVEAVSGVSDDGGPLSYQWKRGDGTPLAGEIYDTLVAGIAGSYYCTVSNAQGSVDSAAAVLAEAVRGVAPSNQDIGTPGAAGSYTLDDATGVYRVIGNGNDIWGESDNFHFVYVPMSGDGEISARVVSILNPNNTGQTWVKAGVMIRDQLLGASRHAFMAATSGNGPAWQGRKDVAPNNQLGNQSMGGAFSTVWVKVVRQGNNFSGYRSTDGVNWTIMPGDDDADPMAQVQPIAMTDPVYVGLAFTSHDNGILATGVFDNVKAQFGGVIGFGDSWRVRNPSPPVRTVWTEADWINPNSNVVLSWDAAAFGPCGATYKVIWRKSPGDLADPDAVPNYVVTDTTATIPAAQIDFDEVIYWRVDVYYGGEREIGNVWSFTTIKQTPVAVTQPQSQLVVPPDGATFSFGVTSDTPVAYNWYKVVDGINDLHVGSGNPWTIANVQVSDEGSYYCIATNNGGSTKSATALLTVGRLIAHWPMDAATVVDANDIWKILDVVGGHHGEFRGGAPGIAPGMIGEAVEFNGIDDHVFVGPVGISGNRPRTITCWVKANVPASQIPNWTNVFGFTSTVTGNSLSFDFNKMFDTQYGIHMYGAEQGMGANTLDTEWHFLAATYDGTTVRRWFDGNYVGAFNLALNTHDNVQMGRRGHVAGGFWPGIIDDARIYNYAMDPISVALLYTAVRDEVVCAILPPYDLNGDCKVDLADVAMVASAWLECNLEPCDRW